MNDKYIQLVNRIEQEIRKHVEFERKARENNEYANIHIYMYIA